MLRHIAQGKTNPAIAWDLYLSHSAIDKNINSIFAKLGLRQEPLVHHRVKAMLTLPRVATLSETLSGAVAVVPTGLDHEPRSSCRRLVAG